MKNILYLIVFVWYSSASAGSYDDFFDAIQHDNPGVVQALLSRGFDPNTVNPKGEFALIQAVRQPAFKVLEVLLQNPATKVDVRTAADESPLMLAALKGYLPLCQRLIEKEADVNKPGWTPLHYAATGGHLAVMRLLLDSHAYIDAASPNGTTPLMMAARYANKDAVQLLLDAGADPMLKNILGLTAIDFARQVHKEESVALIAAAVRAGAPKGAW